MQRRSFHHSNKHHFFATNPPLLYSSMAMDKKLKLGIPRIFRIPFLSCRHRDVPDLTQEPVFLSHRADRQLPESHARQRRSLMTFFMEEVAADQSSIGEGEGRARITSTAPLSSCIKPPEIEKQSNQRRRVQAGKRRKKRRASAKSREAILELANAITSNSSSGDSYHFFTSSDEEKHFGKDQEEEEEEAAFFFSSMSSDSSATMRKQSSRPRRKGSSSRRDEANSQLVEVDRSVAVVKRSSDPYADFRVSMAEMIIEKQIFGAAELEKLLDCFLALNAPYHRQVIVEVFEEICETLFCSWS